MASTACGGESAARGGSQSSSVPASQAVFDGWLTTKETAARLGKSVAYLLHLKKSGRVQPAPAYDGWRLHWHPHARVLPPRRGDKAPKGQCRYRGKALAKRAVHHCGVSDVAARLKVSESLVRVWCRPGAREPRRRRHRSLLVELVAEAEAVRTERERCVEEDRLDDCPAFGEYGDVAAELAELAWLSPGQGEPEPEGLDHGDACALAAIKETGSDGWRGQNQKRRRR